jgi:hypothetical protein
MRISFRISLLNHGLSFSRINIVFEGIHAKCQWYAIIRVLSITCVKARIWSLCLIKLIKVKIGAFMVHCLTLKRVNKLYCLSC